MLISKLAKRSIFYWISVVALVFTLAAAAYTLSYRDDRPSDGVLSIGWPLPYYSTYYNMLGGSKVEAFNSAFLTIDFALYSIAALVSSEGLMKLIAARLAKEKDRNAPSEGKQ